MFVSDNRIDGFKGLVYKYGAAVVIFIVNYLYIAYFFRDLILVPGLKLIEDSFGSDATDQKYALVIFVNNLMAYLVPLIALALIFRSDMPEKGGIRPFCGEEEYRRYPGETALLFVSGLWAAMIGAFVTGLVSTWLNTVFSVPVTKTAFSSLMPQNAYQFIAFGIGSVIIAPVCEELIYRHFLVKPLRKYGDAAAVIMSALMFAMFHFNFDQFLYAFMFGAFLALIAVRSGSVVPCIICHIINNVFVSVRTYLPKALGDAGADAFFAAFRNVVAITQYIIFYGGALFLIAALVLKLLKLKSEAGISVRKQLAVIFTNPLIIIGIVISLVVAFMNLYK